MMKAVWFDRPGGDFELVHLETPDPPPGYVRIRVEACGVTHNDVLVRKGLLPQVQYPRVPGHEVIGVIDRLGAGITGWELGQAVGVGWHGGHCFNCSSCRGGDFINCRNAEITGVTCHGGYAQFMLARQEALVQLPEGLDPLQMAPLLCAGVTSFNALRRSGARAGELVAILGIGGLGHMALQYASRFGFRTVAISRGRDKEDWSRQLGADAFIDSESHDPAQTLIGMGGAKLVLATAPNAASVASLLRGLDNGGQLVLASLFETPIQLSPGDLIQGRRSLQGWPSGDARDAEEAVAFSVRKCIHPEVEIFPMERVAEAFEKTVNDRTRFRAVLRIPH